MADLNTRTIRNRQPLVKSGAAEIRTQYLAFGLGGESFAMETCFVREVLQFERLTEVPLMPPFIRGVINLRGSAVPVVDLSIRFGRPATEALRRTCIVILDIPGPRGAVTAGVMVDNVSEVLDLAPSEIEPAPAFSTDVRAEFIQGVGKIRNTFVILLRVDRLLSAEELDALDRGLPSGVEGA